MFYGSNRSKVRTFGSDSASAQSYTFRCEKKEGMSLIHEAPCHGASSISYRKSIPSDAFSFQAIYSQTYVSLTFAYSNSELVVSRNFQACKHDAFDKIIRKERPGLEKNRPGNFKNHFVWTDNYETKKEKLMHIVHLRTHSFQSDCEAL